ncbi:MAG: DUF2628 domain-containing protein [Candidatus Paracaedibacteraceae bacterium]|nr:DUF2628 domain-containing protein [Candidatus Paracaedibacteraceae bacterium]
MNIQEFYAAIRHKFEPEVLAQASENSLSYGTRQYLKLFKNKGHKPIFISRNIPAIFLGPIWFLYRRMYVHALLFLIISFGIELFLMQLSPPWISEILGDVVFSIYVSLFANSLYINNTRRRFKKGLMSSPSRLSIYLGLLVPVVVGVLGLLILKIYFLIT